MSEPVFPREDVQAPLAAPTYLMHITAPAFRRGRFFSIAIALHCLVIIVILVAVHLHRQPAPEAEPTVALVMQNTPSVGIGEAVVSPVPAPAPRPVPQPKPAPPPPPVPQAPATTQISDLPLPAPPAPPAPQDAPAPAPPAAALAHNGDNRPAGTGLVIAQNVIPAKPDSQANLPPDYPREAMLRGEQGRVLLAIHVRPDGRAAIINIATSSGFSLLDSAARTAVMQWHFLPAQAGGKPVPSVLPFWVSFQLN